MKLNELEGARKDIESLRQGPTTLAKEKAIARLTWQINAVEMKAEAEVAELALFLFDNYLKIGSMSVMLTRGQRLFGEPHSSGNEIQDLWNIRSEAQRLARLKVYG